MATAVKTTDFEQEVIQSEKPVLVDFWAEWCGPCHAVSPILERIADERQDELKLVKVNVDEEQELMMRYGVQSIPTMILFKDGEPAAAAIGAQAKGAIEHGHPVDVSDRAAQPATDRQDAEPDHREDEGPRSDQPARVVLVADDDREYEEDARRRHHKGVGGDRPLEGRPGGDREPLEEAGQNRRNRSDGTEDERDPPAVCAGVGSDADDLREGGRGRKRVGADSQVRQRRMNRVARQPTPQVAELHSGWNLTDSRPRRCALD